MPDEVHRPQPTDLAASPERLRRECRRPAPPVVPAVLVGLGVAAAVWGASRLTAVRRRVHHRRARQVLAEQNRDERYPWP
ncbi:MULTISPECIES: hypothetical protein [unclassified Streptomyces]|uniref:hypothetical protein n=1 Tax=unclassified Streptomyces TaxID=2593676 RepID=UPI003649EDEC